MNKRSAGFSWRESSSVLVTRRGLRLRGLQSGALQHTDGDMLSYLHGVQAVSCSDSISITLKGLTLVQTSERFPPRPNLFHLIRFLQRSGVSPHPLSHY